MYDAYIGVLEQVERNMLGEDEKSITMIRCDYSYTELLKETVEERDVPVLLCTG